jgi:hypothetical protein
MSARFGGQGACVATAHKLSRTIFCMIEKQQEFKMEMLIEYQKNSGRIGLNSWKNNLIG